VEVDSSGNVDIGVSVKTGGGAEVGGKGVGAGTVEAGWQARVRREARVVIHKRRVRSFMLASFL
jgi:UDP-3-O-[3-hydroxymyristoyl] glucosamine N-acyltransferase